MERPIFKGAIDLGCGFIIPMKVIKATDEHDVRFHEYHTKDMGRVGRDKPCKTCGAILSSDEICKGVEVSKGNVITFMQEELDNLPVTSNKNIVVERFIEAGEINPLMYESAYFVVPEEIGLKAYEMFVRGLKKQHKVAIGKIALRQREHICAISPMGNGLLLNTMFYADEVREMPAIPKAQVINDEVELIGQVINKFSKPFDHGIYADEYTNAVQAVIDAKLKGEKVVPVASTEVKVAKSLTDALSDLLNKPA
jgi:DNA end-binding protein Ku